MLKKHLLILVAAAAILVVHHSGNAVNAGDNTHLFLDLCALITLPTRQIPELPSADSGKKAFQEIMKLNNSLSDQTWRKKFARSESGEKERPKYQSQGGKVDELHQQSWDLWTEAEEELDKEKGAKTTEQAAGLNGITPEDRTQLLAILQPLAEEAAETYSELQRQLTSESAITQAKLKQKLAAATYGEGVNQLSDPTDDKLTGGTAAGTSRTTYCGGNTPATTKATSISGLLYCVCAGESGDDSGNFKPCTDQQSAAQGAQAAMTNAAVDIKALENKYPTPPATELTATDILEPLAAFLAKGTAKEKYVVFGAVTTNCGGKNTDGLCVIYNTETAAEAQKLRQAPWRTNLVDAAAMLSNQAAQAGEIKRLTQKLENLKKQAFNLKPQLELRKKLTAVLMAAAPKGPTQSSAQTLQEKGQCEAINKAAQCREKHPKCEWKGKNDEDGEHCKLNETHVAQKATKAEKDGAAGGAVSAGCAKHGTNKEACLADKTGDKQNCAWRSGKNGETDQEKEMCRNGSFLVNKKLALSVVSAAFSALLF
uniref:Variant surface glycoprotein 316 n=1 Tax=Trypanosoma brucei TaxID=5691 RepID=M4SZT5_9TRYP|nr:variant surface glycoprotein 316 [Trypanosoma brucei]